MNGAQPVLEIDHVTFGYGASLAVEDVCLTLKPGEFLALLGPNGAGKSTLMRLAVGLLRPRDGEVRLFGERLSRFRSWSRLAYVPQIASLRPGFPATVREVVLSGRTARRGPFRPFTREDKLQAVMALAAVGMPGFEGRLVSQLSGGQHQRVQLARALAGQPELLFLDEPAAGVDAATKLEVLQVLRDRCRNDRLAVLYVSHDQEALRPFATTVALLDREIVYCGDWNELDERADLLRLSEGLAAADHHRHGD
jgi:zinc transport system ATP-binding protein